LTVAWRGAGARDARQLRGAGLLEGTRATANLRPEQVERSAAGALLKKAADKDDCADMVVAMCRTETMTGQTVVIDSGRHLPLGHGITNRLLRPILRDASLRDAPQDEV